MKRYIKTAAGLGACLTILSLTFLPASLTARPSLTAQTQEAQATLSPQNKQLVTTFEGRVKEYVKLREGLENTLPKLSTDSTPEQIEAHKRAFEEIVRTARPAAKQGDIFTPAAANYIRKIIKDTFTGKDRLELRKTVLEAETQGVPLRVNYSYPETKELVEMPPTLLLRLPQLPKQVKYRFVSRNLLLVDRENGLIVDYMLNALP
ncbi:MAG TPA: hypothetical protein VJT09_00510 [Pyrinomonadaceae bacterium]|nr:hypothetical protein [Pyrinomonadaceae bacterium]